MKGLYELDFVLIDHTLYTLVTNVVLVIAIRWNLVQIVQVVEKKSIKDMILGSQRISNPPVAPLGTTTINWRPIQHNFPMLVRDYHEHLVSYIIKTMAFSWLILFQIFLCLLFPFNPLTWHDISFMIIELRRRKNIGLKL